MANRIGLGFSTISPSVTPQTSSPCVAPPRDSGTAKKAKTTKTERAASARVQRFLRSLRERQGGVGVRFPSTSKRKTYSRALGDSCSGVSRQLAARAIGLFRPDARYRNEAKRFRAEIVKVKPSYPRLSRRLSARGFARALKKSRWYRHHSKVLERIDASQSMLTKKKIQHYNQQVLPAQLTRLGSPGATAKKAEFRITTDKSSRRTVLAALLASGAPIVIGISAHYRGKWHNNCHYVVAIKIPGKKRIMIVDPWPGAKNGGISYQNLRHLRMPGTYRGSKVRLGTAIGYFRNAKTKKPLAVKGLGKPTQAGSRNGASRCTHNVR